MDKKFTEYDGLNLSAVNAEELARWDAAALFEQTLKAREGAPSFVF